MARWTRTLLAGALALALSAPVASCKKPEGPAVTVVEAPEPAKPVEAKPQPKPRPEPTPEPESDKPEAPRVETRPMPIPAPDDVRKPPKDALSTEAGVRYKVLRKGEGKDNPTSSSAVTVHYTGWTTDGKMFDSSYKGGEPSQFRVDGVIAGWTDGLQYMVVGDEMRFWIPESMAYKGKPGRPAGMLVFDVELLAFQ